MNKIYLPTQFRLTLATLALIAFSGCQSVDAPPESKDMRDTMSGAKKFDINNVPPQFREKVMQMRGGAGASRPGAAADAGAKPQ